MIIAHLAWWAGWADKMALTSMNVVSRRIFNVNKSVFNTMNIQQLDCYHISCCYGTHILLSCTLHHAASTGLTFSVCEKCVGWCSDETVQYDWVLLKQCRWDKHVFYRHLKSVSCTTSNAVVHDTYQFDDKTFKADTETNQSMFDVVRTHPSAWRECRQWRTKTVQVKQQWTVVTL